MTNFRTMIVAFFALSIGCGVAAKAQNAPYPQSRVITRLTFDPNTIEIGNGKNTNGTVGVGDNWPGTWGDDGAYYVSYGDGAGFKSRGKRFTIGFAKLTGNPPAITAEDIPSDGDTIAGGGRTGIKSSGAIMVNRTIYMFVRNYKVDGDYRHARLAWSNDHQKTWTWSDWYFSDTFGCPEFVQYGPNYAGARDGYVYIGSQSNNDAYEFTSDIVMARVPRNKISDRAAYEFFAGLDEKGAPTWSADIARRKPIFTDPRGTQRVSMAYNKGLKRYIMTASHRVGDGPYSSSLGIFEAPEPWGPWHTVYYDDHFSGNYRTYHHRFPTPWMSKNGKTMWLLYSGLDGDLYTVCLKKATLETKK